MKIKEKVIAEKVLKEIEDVLVNPLLESEQQDVAAIIERELFKARAEQNEIDKEVAFKSVMDMKVIFDEQVRKLKSEVLDIYHKIGRVKIWSLSNDCVADECEDFFRKKIDEIFPDVSEKQLRVSKREDCSDNCQEGKFCAKHGVTHIKEEVIK